GGGGGAGGRAASQPSGDSIAVTGGMFNAAQPWTVDVSAAAPSDRSDDIIHTLGDLGGWGSDNALQTDFSLPIFYADSGTRRMKVVGTDDYCYGGPDCDSVPAQMPVPAGANIEGSPDLSCDRSGNTDGQGDCHLLVVDRDGRKLYETYQADATADTITAQGFFVWDLDKKYPDNLRGDQCTSADAAGFPVAALTPTADEVASGAVDHALRFILPNDRIKADVYVAPATHAGGPESTRADAPPYGVRFRLRPDFHESGYTEPQKVILSALKRHGMLLSDGGEIALTFADDRTSTAKWAELGIDEQTFSGIGVDQFEVVELGDEMALTYDCVRNP
ncbi:MAG: serine/threonine-protein kinase, partial [Mycobacterium sp.]